VAAVAALCLQTSPATGTTEAVADGLSPGYMPASVQLPRDGEDTYAQTVQHRGSKGQPVSTTGVGQLNPYQEDLFTKDAWLGMQRCATTLHTGTLVGDVLAALWWPAVGHRTTLRPMAMPLSMACVPAAVFWCPARIDPRRNHDSPLRLCSIVEYDRYVETLEDKENAEGCEHCVANRRLLEAAWQVRHHNVCLRQICRPFQVVGDDKVACLASLLAAR
jgi:hypothetical protein